MNPTVSDREWDKLLRFLFALLAFSVCSMIGGLWWVTYRYEHIELPLQFSAWSKHTGNPGRLTFEEWKHLPRGTRKH